MHDQARNFTLFCKKLFPQSFVGKTVLDVGSGDINGNNRFLFEDCSYEGNDVYEAKNVTLVSKTSALPFANESFDTIISTECFEHDPEWKESLQKIASMLKPGGLFCFTCASTARREHGTRRMNPGDSYGVIGQVDGWMDHYKNLTIDDVREAIDLDATFAVWDAYYSPENFDLYFYGVKHGQTLPPFTDPPLYREASSTRVKS
jgi:SAM-dependent methyltransferase